MIISFQTEENKKALIYTSVICVILLLLFIFIRWSDLPPSNPIIQDQIEINLGNDNEGFGDEQPLTKGTPSTVKEKESPASADNSANDNVKPDEKDDADAAPVVKNSTTKPKTQPDKPKVELPAKQTTAPQKPKLTYQGPSSDKNGNNADKDNGYTYQGNNPDGKGDKGSVNGNKDSYGTTPGGSTGGPRVTKGNRKIVKHYKFDGELGKATIYAIIKVSPTGQGKFVGFDKGSTSRSQSYANAVSNYLNNIQFDASENESTVTVQFIFDVN